MAEEEAKSVEDAPVKRKSKFPIILAVLLVVGGGGFFAMKMRGGGAPKKPEVKLSIEKPVELKEFLVNLRDRGVYCRTEIALGVAEGVDPKSLDDHTSIIRDAINLRLSSVSLAEVRTPAGLAKLKRQIAADVNAALNAVDPKKTKDDAAKSDEEKTKSDDKAKGDDKAKAADPAKADDKPKEAVPPKPMAPEHPDWDSDIGPVLKVYFNSFATQ